MSCNTCLRAKQINTCAESLILGTGAADTDYDVYIKNISTGNIDVFDVTSDVAGLITINTTDYTFPEGNSFEIWAVLDGASITERETLTFTQGDSTIEGECITFDSISVKKDGCVFTAEENLIDVLVDETPGEDCLCVTQEMLDEIGGGKILSGTYAQIVTALTAGIDLDVYSHVLITDFQTIYDQPDFESDGTPKASVTTKTSSATEPLLIGLLNANTLKAEAYSALYPKDQIRYDITFNQTEVMGAAAKGRITERIDHLNNRTDYDHRHVVFKRYESAPASGIFNQYKDNGGASQEFTTFQFAAETPSTGYSNNNYLGDYAMLYVLYGNAFLLSNNVFGINAEANTFPQYTVNNTFAQGAAENFCTKDFEACIVGANFSSNEIKGAYNSSFGDSFGQNNFASSISNCTIGDGFSGNSGLTMSNCIFGNNCNGNDFGNVVQLLTFGNDVKNNSFSNDISNVDFTAATHVYAAYHCEIFINAASVAKLSYIDAADTLIIVNANA